MASDQSLRYLANVLADWADQLPLSKVFIFGSRARGDARPDSDLDVAIEFDGSAPEEAVNNWMGENEQDFAKIKAKLGIKLSLHADQHDAVWPAIWKAAGNPVLQIRKVIAVATPKRSPPR